MKLTIVTRKNWNSWAFCLRLLPSLGTVILEILSVPLPFRLFFPYALSRFFLLLWVSLYDHAMISILLCLSAQVLVAPQIGRDRRISTLGFLDCVTHRESTARGQCRQRRRGSNHSSYDFKKFSSGFCFHLLCEESQFRKLTLICHIRAAKATPNVNRTICQECC